jgi:DNA-binding beta-propeller fold protein YncE
MRSAIRGGALSALACLLLATAIAAPAHAERALLSEAALETTSCARCTHAVLPGRPGSEGEIEGPCGLAVSPSGNVYLAEYYHRAIDAFAAPSASSPGQYLSQTILPGANPRFGVNTLDAVCGLALDAAGNLYGNEWHEGALRLTGGEAAIDGGESTGVAIDPSSNRLYVDDRTYVAEYALPHSPGAKPLAKIGLGAIGDGYGLAAAGGHVYVADAADESVDVFDAATPASGPVATIGGHFHSLVDAALAVDPSNGHLLVVDDLQPGFEHPKSALLEFDSPAGSYAFLGKLPGAPVDGGPSGIAVEPSGQLIVTDGNGELSNAFLYGAYEGVASPAAEPAIAGPGTFGAAAASAQAGEGPGRPAAGAGSEPSASASEVGQGGGVRVNFEGELSPRTLPRHGQRPVVATVGAKITVAPGRTPPQLRKIAIAINRHGRFAPKSLPTCRLNQIQPATTAAALAACRRSLVGEGTFSAKVLIPEQAPFPSSGKIYAFNGRWHGHPAILAHVYGTEPVPVSYTIPFELLSQRGTYGTLLRASLPAVTGGSGYITGLSLSLGQGSRARGYVTAGCPVPPSVGGAFFPFAQVDFGFAGKLTIAHTLIRRCSASG